MKKSFILVIALLGLSLTAVAQPKAIGLRGGPFEQEISYEHWFTVFDNDYDFLEGELGVYGGNGFKATAMYNFTFAQPALTDRGEWGLYAGPGVMLGYGSWKTKEIRENVETTKSGSSPFLGAAFQLGMEYTFWFPLQLSVDFRPAFLIPMKVNSRWYGFAFSARYAF
jgi:hypothetical protein